MRRRTGLVAFAVGVALIVVASNAGAEATRGSRGTIHDAAGTCCWGYDVSFAGQETRSWDFMGRVHGCGSGPNWVPVVAHLRVKVVVPEYRTPVNIGGEANSSAPLPSHRPQEYFHGDVSAPAALDWSVKTVVRLSRGHPSCGPDFHYPAKDCGHRKTTAQFSFAAEVPVSLKPADPNVGEWKPGLFIKGYAGIPTRLLCADPLSGALGGGEFLFPRSAFAQGLTLYTKPLSDANALSTFVEPFTQDQANSGQTMSFSPHKDVTRTFRSKRNKKVRGTLSFSDSASYTVRFTPASPPADG